MTMTIYKTDGLSYQNEGYLYALMNQLDQDVNDMALAGTPVKAVDSKRALKQLRDSLAGREIEELDEELEAKEFGSLFGVGNEGKEGMEAFLEKRKPNW